MNRFVAAFLVLFLVTIPVSRVSAEWYENGNVVCAAQGHQRYQNITEDGAGGGVIVWTDYRDPDSKIYAQRFGADGLMLWQQDGVAVCPANGEQERPVLAGDGAGGAFVAWADLRDGGPDRNLYIQWLDSDGNPLWAPNGIRICSTTGDQYRPYLVPDDAGGVIVIWPDAREGWYHIYAQRFDSAGNKLWAPDGVRISTPMGSDIWQYHSKAVTDGAGGAIIAWHAVSYMDDYWGDLHVRRIDASGDTLWPGNQTNVGSFVGGMNYYPAITADGAGGAIVAWPRNVESVSYTLYAQRMDPGGAMLWQAGGQVVETSNGRLEHPWIESDGAQGAFITWGDYGDENLYSDTDIYIRRILSGGTLDWASETRLADAPGAQIYSFIVPDGSGGVIISWRDFRNGSSGDIFAQKVDASGVIEWGEAGLPVCTAGDVQSLARLISDTDGGAFISWYDHRTGSDFDVYVQRVLAEFTPPPPVDHSPSIVSVSDVPGDQGEKMTIIWSGSDFDVEAYREINHYSIWRRIEFDDPDPLLMSDPDRRIRIPEGSAGFAWEWILDAPARMHENYAATVPSLHDSTALGTGWQYFMVSAVEHNDYYFYDSAVDSGYSVDNLSPCVPVGLQAYPAVADLLLEWDANTESDLLRYAVYRGDDEDFVPGAENLIASPMVNAAVDPDWGLSSVFYYKVSAIDIHGNESEWAVIRASAVSSQLQSFSSNWSQGTVALRWTVASIEEGTVFHINRSEDAGETWQAIDNAEVERDDMNFAFIDRNILGGREYTYRVDIDDSEESRIFFVSEKVQTPEIPLTLQQNFPNPFNPSTTISFYLPEQNEISLTVYDVSGRLIRELEGGALGAGWHSATWDGMSASGNAAGSGAYFCRLKAGKEIITVKMILLR